MFLQTRVSAGSISKRCSNSQLAARGWPHVVPIRRSVRDAHAVASGAIRGLFSQLLVTPRGQQAPDPLLRHRRPAASRAYPERELGLALLTDRLKALNVASTSPEPEKCVWT